MWDRDARQPGMPDSPKRRRVLRFLPFASFVAVTTLTIACEPAEPPPQIASLDAQSAQAILSKAATARSEVIALPLGSGQESLGQGKAFVEAGVNKDPLVGRVVMPVGPDATFTDQDKLQVTIVSDGRAILPNKGARLGEAREFLRSGKLGQETGQVPCVEVVFQAAFPLTTAEIALKNDMAIFVKQQGSREIAEYLVRPQAPNKISRRKLFLAA